MAKAKTTASREKFGADWADIAARLVAIHGTLDRAAVAVDVSKSTLQRWKNGSRAPRSRGEAERVLAHLERLETAKKKPKPGVGGFGFEIRITCKCCGHAARLEDLIK